MKEIAAKPLIINDFVLPEIGQTGHGFYTLKHIHGIVPEPRLSSQIPLCQR